MQTLKLIFAMLICTLMLGACGLKGPLYLPGEEPGTKHPQDQGIDDDDLTVSKKKDKGSGRES